MTPHPPSLPPRISAWQPDELFYIVKHGVKFTGMPAWPARQRDDEVWAMVAFLLLLPDLDAESYRRLVHGESPGTSADVPIQGLLGPQKEPRAVTENCARCHGVDGRGRGQGAFPRLAGQRPTYLYAALQAYAHGERQSGIMAPVAAALHPDEMRELALYYASLQAPTPPLPLLDTTLAIERGKAIARHGIPRQRVPSCIDCHGPGARHRNPFYPVLAGQYADYLVVQLELFKQEQRGGSSLCPPHAPGGQPAHSAADARCGAVLRIVAGHRRSAIDGAWELWDGHHGQNGKNMSLKMRLIPQAACRRRRAACAHLAMSVGS